METDDFELTELEEEKLCLLHPSRCKTLNPRTFCWSIFSAVDDARRLSVELLEPYDEERQHNQVVEILARELRDRDVDQGIIALTQGHPMWFLEALEKALLEGEMA